MAQGIILSSANSDTFKPLTYQMPVGLLPLVNKPLIEHHIEWFMRNGIKDVRLSCNHLANKVEDYFGNGIRWGARVTYNLERPPFGSITALRQMRADLPNDTIVAVHSDLVTGIDLKAALEFHWSKRADATFVCSKKQAVSSSLPLSLGEHDRLHAVSVQARSRDSIQYYDAGICIFEPDILDLLPESLGYNLLQAVWLAAQNAVLALFGYRTDEPVMTIAGWKGYYSAQVHALEGKVPGIHIPGLQAKSDVWVGKNTSLSNECSFEGPVVIGDNCRIGKGVTLGAGTVIGHDVMIDVGVSLERSMILSRTFVAAQTSVRNSILQGNLVVDIDNDAFQPAESGLLAFEIHPGRFKTRLYHFLNRLVAAFCIVALAPLVVTLMVGLVIGIKFPLYTRLRRLKVDLKELARGNLRLEVFDLLFFGPIDPTRQAIGYNPEPETVLPQAISRMANLLNVLKGDILIVGNRPMDPEHAFTVTEEWRRTRFKTQCGMLSILDTNEVRDMSDDERGIAEGYYAIHRSFTTDLKILVNATLRLFGRMSGSVNVIREEQPSQRLSEDPEAVS